MENNARDESIASEAPPRSLPILTAISALIRVVKPAFDVIVPVFLVYFAFRTDDIQKRQTDIQASQFNQLELQNRLIAAQNDTQEKMRVMADVQNKSEIGFKLDINFDKKDTSDQSMNIYINNSGAPIHGIVGDSYSYLDIRYGFGYDPGSFAG